MSHSTKLKILIFEPDIGVLNQLESWVKTICEDVYPCNDSMTAFDIFNEIYPDIILVSQNLNSMDVIDFIHVIKNKVPKQAIILMLNSDDSNIFKSCVELQVDKYLNKPIDLTSLNNTIEALSQEKIWHKEYMIQKKILEDYKEALDKSFSVSKHDKNGKIFYVNNSFCKTTKLSYSDAMKGEINPLSNPNVEMLDVWRALHNEKIYRDRQIFKFKDKKDHIIDITAVPIAKDNNDIEEYLVFSNDVTDVVAAARKIKEQELNNKLQKLEHIKEISKIKDDFLTIFSHELKTPLNAIINFSEYIKKHLLKVDFAKRDILVEQVSQINASGWIMLDMITNMIDSIKLRNGEIKLNKSKFSLNIVVNNIIEKYTDDLKDIKVRKLFKNECFIENDKERVEQLLNNLISNAIKYCRGNIAVVIKSSDENFVLEIIDDGDGFGDLNKVFELFEQSNEDKMTRTAKGTGVGLFVVKKLCTAMNYKINIETSKNLGGARVIIKGKKGI